MNIRSEIEDEFTLVANQQNKKLQRLSDDLVLMESGMDSLCFAILVARLEDRLGIDPFEMAEDVRFPVTFGDFVQFYECAAV